MYNVKHIFKIYSIQQEFNIVYFCFFSLQTVNVTCFFSLSGKVSINPAGALTFFRLLHPSKTLAPIFVTEFGIMILVNFLLFAKALSAIFVMLL